MSTPSNLPLREYGPTFDCPTCDGTGMQTNAKGTGLPLKRGPKPCEDCERSDVEVVSEAPGDHGTITTVGKPSGKLAEAEAPWQCRYCSYFANQCYAGVKPRLAFDKEAKPHYWIERRAFEESGIRIEGPKNG